MRNDPNEYLDIEDDYGADSDADSGFDEEPSVSLDWEIVYGEAG